jgi:hypothetical protein
MQRNDPVWIIQNGKRVDHGTVVAVNDDGSVTVENPWIYFTYAADQVELDTQAA